MKLPHSGNLESSVMESHQNLENEIGELKPRVDNN